MFLRPIFIQVIFFLRIYPWLFICQLFKARDLLEILNSVFVLDGLDSVLLCLAARGELEVCVVTEVLETLVGGSADVDLHNAGFGELVGDACVLGLEFDVEGAEVSELMRLPSSAISLRRRS